MKIEQPSRRIFSLSPFMSFL